MYERFFNNFFEILQKGPPPTHFADPTFPKYEFFVFGAQQQ